MLIREVYSNANKHIFTYLSLDSFAIVEAASSALLRVLFLNPNKMFVLSLLGLMILQLKAVSQEEVKHVNMFSENWFDKIKNVSLFSMLSP